MTIESWIMLNIIFMLGITISLYIGSKKCRVIITVIWIVISLAIVVGHFLK